VFSTVLFYVFALGVALSALSVVTRKNPIASAVSLVSCFFFLSAIYAMLDAHFVAVTQILVYAGAIMVLFIFVIMLLNLRGAGGTIRPTWAPRAVAGLAAAGLVGTGLVTALSALTTPFQGQVPADFGTIEQVGNTIFGGQYLLPFEVASALLTVAMVGAVVLAKREV
jgi:NADH-quinone oxidoreductase subunit J